MLADFLDSFYLLLIIFFIVQGIVNIALSLYAWEVPDRVKNVGSPAKFSEPTMSFTVLLPARHEQDVIGETLLSIFSTNYPSNKIEILLICQEDDYETIQAAKKSIRKNNIYNAKIVMFNDLPVNKPHGLNTGLLIAKNKITVIFDAEDSVDKDIFNIANTLFITKKPDVIQAGVQLMNFNSRWFSSHNVAEYYFWFRSRMHFNTRVGMVPLGGNTVFFKTSQLKEIGGWDEDILAEDAEIGIRLSVRGKKIISTYDSRHITKEETPLTISDFIKQRTRWNQGFIQVLNKKEWKQYDSLVKRIFSLYTLSFPYVQSLLMFVTLLCIFIGIEFKIPVVLSWLSFTPLIIIITQILVNCFGLHEFAHEQNLKIKWRTLILMFITFFAYQVLLTIGAIRATSRQLSGKSNWEKTSHNGQHRFDPAFSAIEEGTGIAL